MLLEVRAIEIIDESQISTLMRSDSFETEQQDSEAKIKAIAGIGRCRHSSNFSNRHTLVNTNSAGERKSISNEHHCQCQCGMIKNLTRDHLISSEGGWKKFARKYLMCQEIESVSSRQRTRGKSRNLSELRRVLKGKFPRRRLNTMPTIWHW